MLSSRIPISEEETKSLQELTGDELLQLSERMEEIKTMDNLEKQVHRIVNQRMNTDDRSKPVSSI